ncbi:Chitinase 1 [Clydaea vesicula]|uniref:Chitinase 1 n=1 Tax=Clydaea vesicula TaxID=447962 RepID=A0AAD5Y3B6_9FUNG|nr:Chitinase 1 [Clydaea vesicula]
MLLVEIRTTDKMKMLSNTVLLNNELAAAATLLTSALAVAVEGPVSGDKPPQYPYESTYWEATLGDFCKNTDYTIYHITGLMQYFDGNMAPAIDFAYHCQYPTNKPPNWKKPISPGFSLLLCPNIAADIITCQSLGKKVVLSLSPRAFMLDSSPIINGNVSANNIWNYFFNGNIPDMKQRPFGSAVLDGVDLMHSTNADGVLTFIAELRRLFDSDNSKKYTISGSPLCNFPDYIFSWPVNENSTESPRVLTENPKLIDYVVTFMLSSPNICGYQFNEAKGFWSSIETWSEYLWQQNQNISLVVGLVSFFSPQWVDASGLDYVPVSELISKNVIGQMKMKFPNFGGIALQETSYDSVNNPCIDDMNSTYSTVVSQLLKLIPNEDNSTAASSISCSPIPAEQQSVLGPPKNGGGDLDRAAIMQKEKDEIEVTNSTTTTTTTTKPFTAGKPLSDNNPSNSTVTIGVVVAVVVAVIIMTFVVFYCRKRRKIAMRGSQDGLNKGSVGKEA